MHSCFDHDYNFEHLYSYSYLFTYIFQTLLLLIAGSYYVAIYMYIKSLN